MLATLQSDWMSCVQRDSGLFSWSRTLSRERSVGARRRACPTHRRRFLRNSANSGGTSVDPVGVCWKLLVRTGRLKTRDWKTRHETAFSTPAVWCRVFQSRVFHPCIFATPAFSSPAFSAPPSAHAKTAVAKPSRPSITAFHTLSTRRHFPLLHFHPCDHLLPHFQHPRFLAEAMVHEICISPA